MELKPDIPDIIIETLNVSTTSNTLTVGIEVIINFSLDITFNQAFLKRN